MLEKVRERCSGGSSDEKECWVYYAAGMLGIECRMQACKSVQVDALEPENLALFFACAPRPRTLYCSFTPRLNSTHPTEPKKHTAW